MNAAPEWVKHAAHDALITRAEVMEWMRLGCYRELREFIDKAGFPSPAIKGPRTIGNMITKNCKWRVGAVRAWIRNQQLETSK